MLQKIKKRLVYEVIKRIFIEGLHKQNYHRSFCQENYKEKQQYSA